MDKVSYALGIGIGRQLAQMGATDINTDDFGQAIKDAISGRLQLDEQEAQMIVQDFFQRKSEEQGTLINVQVFDSSYKRGQTATFGLNQVIKGWTEGLQLMQEGAKYRFFIPYHLAYGAQGAGQNIPPYATLIFDVELVKVK